MARPEHGAAVGVQATLTSTALLTFPKAGGAGNSGSQDEGLDSTSGRSAIGRKGTLNLEAPFASAYSATRHAWHLHPSPPWPHAHSSNDFDVNSVS